MEESEPIITFKRRGKGIDRKNRALEKGIIESKEENQTSEAEQKNASDSDDDLGVDRTKLKALEILKKTSKSNGFGISVNELNKGSLQMKSGLRNKSRAKSSINSQFSSKPDYGLQKIIPHEKIMEEYIDQKLGLHKQQEESKPKTIDDELYSVPEELKVGSDLKNEKVKMEDEGIVSSWSTGIAEIQLPSTYRTQNAIETHTATQKRIEVDPLFSALPKSESYHRFQAVDPSLVTSAIPSRELEKLTGTKMNSSDATFLTKKRTFTHASDDRVVAQFKNKIYKR